MGVFCACKTCSLDLMIMTHIQFKVQQKSTKSPTNLDHPVLTLVACYINTSAKSYFLVDDYNNKMIGLFLPLVQAKAVFSNRFYLKSN